MSNQFTLNIVNNSGIAISVQSIGDVNLKNPNINKTTLGQGESLFQKNIKTIYDVTKLQYIRILTENMSPGIAKTAGFFDIRAANMTQPRLEVGSLVAFIEKGTAISDGAIALTPNSGFLIPTIFADDPSGIVTVIMNVSVQRIFG